MPRICWSPSSNHKSFIKIHNKKSQLSFNTHSYSYWRTEEVISSQENHWSNKHLCLQVCPQHCPTQWYLHDSNSLNIKFVRKALIKGGTSRTPHFKVMLLQKSRFIFILTEPWENQQLSALDFSLVLKLQHFS